MRCFYCIDRTIQELGDDTDRSSDAGSTSSRTKKRKKTVRKKNVIEVDSGDDEKPKKKKTKTNEKTKAKKGKKKGLLKCEGLDHYYQNITRKFLKKGFIVVQNYFGSRDLCFCVVCLKCCNFFFYSCEEETS